MELNEIEIIHENIVPFPGADTSKNLENIPTPKFDEIITKSTKLSVISQYKTEFDFKIYRDLELRYAENPIRGGITFNTPMKLVNSHATCQQCLYAFEVDTYGRGCTHDCVYCYAKEQLTSHGYWNKPFPMPVDISELWNTFYTVFETDKKHKWREVMEKRTPIRIGSMSDSFMFMDKKYGVTKEFLKILDFYDYPYIIFTRSDLVSHDDYLDVLNPELCSVQMSIASTNDVMNKLIEPGTPSAKRRLKALEKLVKNGFWTTVRLNPFFPMYPDGYFSDPLFDKNNMPEPFNFSSFEMVDEIAQTGCQSVLAGVVRLSPFALNQIEKVTGRDLRPFFKKESRKSTKDWHYSDEEIRAYYERIHAKALQNGIQFTTCYIGNGEAHFWKDQDLWSNKKDCCNVIGNVNSFKGNTSRDILWDTRIKHSSHKTPPPDNVDTLYESLGDFKIIKIEANGLSLNDPTGLIH